MEQMNLTLEYWKTFIGKPVKFDGDIVGEVTDVFEDAEGNICTTTKLASGDSQKAIVQPK